MKLNRSILLDKIRACFIGKNIGGTIGTPYEGKQEMQDISGFVTMPGEVLPNDDLDLQLVWLYALEKEGPWKINERILAEYWLAYITPYWNEYGISKANAHIGIAPPLSGEINNEAWKNSNGAWIRSEVWACLTPGLPYITMKYAFMDACFDHGYGEGTYAELFTSSLESMAIVNEGKSIRELIEAALTFIPESCRVAKAVRLVLGEYDKGTDYRALREMIVKQSADIGFFQAPANIAFVVLGLIYGEGDFKKSIIYAVNCGDDTDCTGATVGAFLGLYYGSKGIPEDWSEYIGDKIVTVSINGHIVYLMPKTCAEFAERIVNMIVPTLKANGINCEIGEFDNDISVREHSNKADIDYIKDIFSRGKYVLGDANFTWGTAHVEFEREPIIKPGESIALKLVLHNMTRSPKNVSLEFILPDGFTAEHPHNIYLEQDTGERFVTDPKAFANIRITAGDTVSAKNRIIAVLSTGECLNSGFVEINLLG